MKHTLRSKVLDDVKPYLEADGTILRHKYMFTKDALHTDIVKKAIDKAKPNRVLGSAPPPIHKSEKTLPRITRVTLSQLRSGHCARLRDFQLRIGKSDSNICPDCDLAPQTVNHIFDCPAHPTTLSTRDLWENPRDVADLLRSFQAFVFVPAPATPPRRRPPARPPAAPPDSPFSPISLPPSPLLPPRILPLMPISPPSSGSSSPLRGVNS